MVYSSEASRLLVLGPSSEDYKSTLPRSNIEHEPGIVVYMRPVFMFHDWVEGTALKPKANTRGSVPCASWTIASYELGYFRDPKPNVGSICRL